MSTKTKAGDQTDILRDNGPADEGFFENLQREMATDPVTEAHIERGPIVTVNVTAMRQTWGQDCIEIDFPERGVDLQRLSAAAAARLAADLAAASEFVGMRRSVMGEQK